MDSVYTCPICLNFYNSDDREPLVLNCKSRHIWCKNCICTFIEDRGYVICDLDNEKDQRHVKDYKSCAWLKEKLNRLTLICYKHDEHTLNLSYKKFKPICKKCEDEQNIKTANLSDRPYEAYKLISLTNADIFVFETLVNLYAKCKKKLSFEMKCLIKESLTKNLHSRICMVYLMKKYIQRKLFCDKHKRNTPAAMNKYNYKFLCQKCLSEKLQIRQSQLVSDVKTFSLQNSYSSAANSYSLEFDNFNYIFFNLKDSNDLKNKVFDNLYDNEMICVYSRLARFLNEPQSLSPWSLIEYKEFKMPRKKKIQSLACPNCLKSFHLGQRIPVQLSCRHLLCYYCFTLYPYCWICKQTIEFKSFIFIEDLYIYPKCSMCRYNTGLSNLPFHGFCDCIICASCSLHTKKCDDCSSDTDFCYQLKISKRAFQSLNYFRIAQKCWVCQENNASWVCMKTYKMICKYCKSDDKIELMEFLKLDKILIDSYFQHRQYFEGLSKSFKIFPALPIRTKIELFYYLQNNSLNPSTKLQRNFNFQLLQRFKILYPINSNDKRIFSFDFLGTNILNLQVLVSVPIMICGIILAGPIKFSTIPVNIKCSNGTSEVIIENKKVCGKQYLVKFCKPIEGQDFDLEVVYPVDAEVYSGKCSESNVIEKNDVNFTFRNKSKFDIERIGPILGLLYCLDYC